MSKTKEILDTVHGYISVPCEYLDNIVNTVEFQRLQHVSQSAIRSLFPSANHTRYMHSLGVFYIGQMIIAALGEQQEGISPEKVSWVQKSYLIACLLHDIGHAPFSHSFEDYLINGNNLRNELESKFAEDFKKDNKKFRSVKPHEYASAVVTCRTYGEIIPVLGGDLELVCRMIIGNMYSDSTRSYENCYISLLHGDIVDADRLDYACRDVWASGYSTSNIDLHRLIDSLKITQKGSKYVVSFSNSVINEIESLMTIKEFQSHNVFSHRIIAYEQYLLIHAAESMAAHLFGVNDEEGNKKLKEIIHIDSLSDEGQKLVKDGKQLYYANLLSDEDIICLIKQDEDNMFSDELFGRRYERFALWRTRDEFYSYFSRIKPDRFLGDPDDFENKLRKALKDICNITDIAIGSVNYSNKSSLEDLYIRLNRNRLVKYSDLGRPLIIDKASELFYYCFVLNSDYNRLKNNEQEDLCAFRERIMKTIADDFQNEILN